MQCLGHPQLGTVIPSLACQGHATHLMHSEKVDECGFLNLFCIFQEMLMLSFGVFKATLI